MGLLPDGGGERSGDAIAMRLLRRDTPACTYVIIDTGFSDDGDALVEHFRSWYGDPGTVDLLVVIHPDQYHAKGAETVLDEPDVGSQAIHRLDLRGGAEPPGGKRVSEIVAVAEAPGTAVVEPFARDSGLGTRRGPDLSWTEEVRVDAVRSDGADRRAQVMLLRLERCGAAR